MNNRVSRKDKIRAWWRVEGKIEISAGLIAMIVMISYWENLLVQGAVMIFGAFWALAKIYFRRDQKLFLILLAGFVFFQGVANIVSHFAC